ncbi:hypothetical protein [Endozoicomonas sp. 8E]|uniref:hypothetical protein n=1 Tax=Endozoicomonas sp. 8E TaxID=3035692 RepID=UPI002939266B|nr:hypothetical protein [Endozoicomonas sp. 8E]WOG25479.1 hypothetical protein P6910_12890 [Endozoicomonas sp. 8E]
MEADEMYSNRPFYRPNCVSDPEAVEPSSQLSCLCGNHICNSEVNPSWSYMKYALVGTLLVTGGVSGAGFGVGIPELGGGCLGAGLVALGLEALFFSHTNFPKEFQVSFTFSSSNLEIETLQHMLPILQYSGSYELLSFSLNEQNASNTLSFRLRVTNAVNADQLTNWLETRNQQLANPFEIEVSSTGEPTDNEQVDNKQADNKQADGEQVDGEQVDKKQADSEQADNKQADSEQADNKQADNKQADSEQADNKQADSEQVDNKQADSEQADNKPADSEQADNKPADSKQADNKPADSEQADNKQPDNEPANSAQADNEPKDNELMDTAERETVL